MSSELLELATDIATEAATLAKRLRGEGVEVAASKSTATDIVTFADRATEDYIRSRIAEARPDDGILGEEGGQTEPGTSGLSWIVDPIDGTVNYLYGIPHYAVSIAVVEGGVDPVTWTALAGAVVNPSLGEVFTASAGGGAFLNGAPITVRDAVDLSEALIGTGFDYDSEHRAEQGRVVAELLPFVRDIRREGSAALDLCAVAAGRLDGFFESTLKPWDFAAGALIVTEAGGLIADPTGGPRIDRMIVAGGRALGRELGAALYRFGA